MRVAGPERGPAELLGEPLPRGREDPRLVEGDPLAESAEAAQHLPERLARARRGRARDLTHAGADRPRLLGVVEEELPVAGEPVDRDGVGGNPGRVDERNDQAHPLAREHPVQLETAEEGVGDRAEAGDVLEVLGRARYEGVQALGVQYLREP